MRVKPSEALTFMGARVLPRDDMDGFALVSRRDAGGPDERYHVIWVRESGETVEAQIPARRLSEKMRDYVTRT